MAGAASATLSLTWPVRSNSPGEQTPQTCLALVLPGDTQPLGWYRTAWSNEKQQREQLTRRVAALQEQFDVERADLREQADLWRDQVALLVKEYTGSQPTTDPILALRALIKRLKAASDPTDPGIGRNRREIRLLIAFGITATRCG
ncbi:hypothetical protein [Candidatus Amarolinea dominans]|uniref:hypothetical protein n=1 Tax=Candidatus Amarolinea dominans TaxID=3140696 RepID=UPI001E01661F|nr:hypothetical protein [Anaerolineae bacterium]